MNICEKCNTENETEYIYCKNCGARLNNDHSDDTNNSKFNQYSGGENNTNAGQYTFCTDSINGIPTDEIILFIGKKAINIVPKFTKMEIFKSKTSWCWPVAILGFIFGPLGAALWFFYRKMFKPALLLLLAGFVLSCTVSAMTYNTRSAITEIVTEALENGDINEAFNTINSIDIKDSILSVSANLINNIVSIATGVLTGIYGYYMYKNHCVEKISSFRNNLSEQKYYKIGLSALGGTSGGAVAIAIVAFAAIDSIADLFVNIIH